MRVCGELGGCYHWDSNIPWSGNKTSTMVLWFMGTYISMSWMVSPFVMQPSVTRSRLGQAALSSTSQKHHPNTHLSWPIQLRRHGTSLSWCMQQYFFFSESGPSPVQLCLKPAYNALSLCYAYSMHSPYPKWIPNAYQYFMNILYWSHHSPIWTDTGIGHYGDFHN